VHDDVARGLWRARLRWRMRGAWLWPSFAIAVFGDAVLMHELPLSGDSMGLLPALLEAGFLNLVVVAVGARLGGRALRHRRPELPRVVADDYAGTALIVVVAGALLAAGLAHRPTVLEARRDFDAMSRAVRAYVAEHAPLAYRVNIDRADTWKQAPDTYRTCVPGPDPARALCLYVSTARSPPTVRVDRDQSPNARLNAGGAR
jgi:hypothetical protein